MSNLYHITSKMAADEISANELYYSETFSQEGFIHCSYRDQLSGVAARYYADRKDLVVLEIDPTKLACEIREENLTGAQELFPHLYGPIPEVAITAIYDFTGSTGELSERPDKGLIQDKNMTTDLELKVRTEIEALHEFFVGWFSGNLTVNSFEDEFLSRFDPNFQLIPPAGHLMSLQALHGAVQRSHGTNPEFRIAIRNVKILKVFDEHILATYEEWQRNALASKPADNGRIASVIFKHCEPLQWLHVHETWLPESIASAGPYDF